ncbi:MAG: glutaredoxin family protein [Candidatus Xenobia bacterium]
MSDHSKVQVFGTAWCGDCHRSKAVLRRLGVPYLWVDVDEDPQGRAVVMKVAGKMKVPVLIFPDGSNVVEPSDAELTGKVEALGLQS